MRSLAIALILLALAACGDAGYESERPAEAAAVAPAEAPAPAVPEGDLAGFAPDGVLAARFSQINDGGYPIVVLENLTGRDIDDIRGGFRLMDADGNVLHSTGFTEAVPGSLLVAAGGTVELSPFGLNSKPELMERLATAPDELSFSFIVDDVRFMEDAVTD